MAKALSVMACALIFRVTTISQRAIQRRRVTMEQRRGESEYADAGWPSICGWSALRRIQAKVQLVELPIVRKARPVQRPSRQGGTPLSAGDDGTGGLIALAGEMSTGGHRVRGGHPGQAGQNDVGGEQRTGGRVLAAGQVALGGQMAPAGQVAGGDLMNAPGGQIVGGEEGPGSGQMAPAGQVAGAGLMNPPGEPHSPGGHVMAGERDSEGGQMAAAGQMAAGGQVAPGGQVGNGDDLDFSQCENFLTPADEPNPEYLFSACPAYISVATCRAPMQALLARNPTAQLCPLNSGAAAGEEWCPTRGFDNGCWGYVGTGGDANTMCNSGATALHAPSYVTPKPMMSGDPVPL